MDDDAIWAVEAELRAAMLTNDVAVLDRLLDDELIFTALDGSIVGKQDDLDAHRARLLRLTRFEPGERRLLRIGTTAVVSLRVEHEGSYDSGPGDDVMPLFSSLRPEHNVFDAYCVEQLRAADTLLLGRSSYEGFNSFWP